MVYWEDIPSDAHRLSPFSSATEERFLSFTPDAGGFNNIRMAMETVIALSHAMGRTLIIPPAKRMYLLDKKQGNDKPEFTFADFYPLTAINAEHKGFNTISTEEFLQRQVQSPNPALAKLPPGNRTNWDGSSDQLFNFYRKAVHNVIWDPNKCIAYFPASREADAEAMQELYQNEILKNRVSKKNNWEKYVGKPPALNASLVERLAEFSAERKQLCLYGPDLQQEPILHFPTGVQDPNDPEWDSRLLVHFYGWVFLEDIHQDSPQNEHIQLHTNFLVDLWMKRFIRDHVRYTDEIQCAAARVVEAMRKIARSIHQSEDGEFHTMHVRRGDFQYKMTRVSAQDILKVAQRVLPSHGNNTVVYIATDERDKSFFQPLRDHYQVFFMDDFKTELKDVNSNYFGMIDQLIASRGKLFIGCWFSTFTGYINRLRGYHAQKRKEEGYENGDVKTSFYYAPPDRFTHMHEYYPVKKSFYAREFPSAWRLLDRDLDDGTFSVE